LCSSATLGLLPCLAALLLISTQHVALPVKGDEVARLERLDAAMVLRHDGHTVMRDPEGYEFCVEPRPVGR
jgi:hypothetical protein